MLQHQQEAHKDIKDPEFNFRVVKTFKTCLERQVGEAIRIQSRGNVLNRRGKFSRCTLTRLVLDSKWEEETWKRSWERTVGEPGDEEVSLVVPNKSTTKGRGSKENSKKRKLEDAEGHVWGEPIQAEDERREEFLRGDDNRQPKKTNKQTKLMVMAGLEWWAHEVVKDMVVSAAVVAQDMELMAGWEEWSGEVEQRQAVQLPQVKIEAKRDQPKGKKRGKVLSGQPSIISIFKRMTEAKESSFKQGSICRDDLPVGWKDEELDKMYRLEMVKYLQKGWKDKKGVSIGMLKNDIQPSGSKSENEFKNTEEVSDVNQYGLRVVTGCDVSSRVCGLHVRTETNVSKLRYETMSGCDVLGEVCVQMTKTKPNFRNGEVETDRQEVKTSSSFSSPRSKRNIFKKKSVETLNSLHTTEFGKGGGGPTEKGGK